MKKIKLLIPTLATIGSLAAAAPILTACNKKGDEPTVEFTVHFETNGGSAIEDVKVKKGGLVTEPTAPTKSGYTFAGWHKDSGLTEAFRFNVDKITADTTLYAKWVQAGGQVTQAQWTQAFADLADTRKEMNFWTDGSIKLTRYKPGTAQVDEEATISDIIFNENRHYGFMSIKDADTGDVATQDLAGESFNDFFFYAKQVIVGGEVQETGFDVGYDTDITSVFYTVFDSASQTSTFGDYTYNQTVQQYEHNDTDYVSTIKFFTEDGKKKIQKIYLKEKTDDGDDLVFDIRINHTKKSIVLPEGWNENEKKATTNWGSTGLQSGTLQKNKELESGVICSFKVSNDQAGSKSIKITDMKGEVVPPNNGQFAICITDASENKTWEILDNTYVASNVWSPTIMSSGLVAGTQLTILFTDMADDDFQFKAVLSN